MGGRGANFEAKGNNKKRTYKSTEEIRQELRKGLPSLEGSEKQVAWAESIRDRVISNMAQAEENYRQMLARSEEYLSGKPLSAFGVYYGSLYENYKVIAGKQGAKEVNEKTDARFQKEFGGQVKRGTKEFVRALGIHYEEFMRYGKEKLKNNSAKFWIDNR